MSAGEARFLDAIEAAAYRDFFAGAPDALAASLGLRTQEIAGATALVASGIPDAFFNRVIGLGVHRPAAAADVEAVIAAYAQAGVKKWQVHVSPGAEPDTLGAQLEARGFTVAPRRSWAKMLRGTAAPPLVSTPAVVRRAREGEAAAVGEAIASAFGMPAPFGAWLAGVAARPRWRAYAALEDERVVGGAFLYLDNDAAWLGAGGVVPEARERHVHRALMALRIREALEAGCTRIATETGEAVGDEPNPSLANMRACGFRRIFSRLNYAAP
jgi:hypothetical protein